MPGAHADAFAVEDAREVMRVDVSVGEAHDAAAQLRRRAKNVHSINGRKALRRQPEIGDLRTAAFVTAINKVAIVYEELGIFP